MKNVLVLLNERAGTLLDAGTSVIVGELEAALKPRCERLDIRLLKPRALKGAIEQAASGPHDTVIIGGGDGSVSLAAGAFTGIGKALGVLPFGTMNLLGRDLGMPPDPHEAISALATVKPRQIDLAEINGRPFHTLSGLGFFSEMARAREEVRGHPFGRLPGVAMAWFRAMVRTYPFTVEVKADGHSEQVRAFAVLVTNNKFGPDWRRERLDEGLLEIHIVEEQGALAKLKGSAALITGAWREQQGIRSIATRSLTIDRPRSHAWASTDGELGRERIPLRYRVLPQALTVLAVDGDQASA
jgi:diacylglycerol kinase family enzyme